MRGSLRLVLGPLIPQWPCFETMRSRGVVSRHSFVMPVSLSFATVPTVDFGLKAAGCDVLDIPGITRYLHHVIGEAVASVLVWPLKVRMSRPQPESDMLIVQINIPIVKLSESQ